MIADGVSASPLSEVGAEIAVQSCQEYFSDFRYSPFLTEERLRDILYDALNYALRRIQESDQGKERIPFAKYTTLHVLLYGEKIGLHWAQAGDGAIFLGDREGRWTRVGGGMKSEEGVPVTLQDGPDAWRFGSLDAGQLDAVLMTTDGVAEALEGDTPRETTNALLGLLAAPLDGKRGKDELDACYSDLFFGEGKASHKESSPVEAAERLRAVTDDVTVLLIRGLHEGAALPHEEAPTEPPRGMPDAAEKIGDWAVKLVRQGGKLVDQMRMSLRRMAEQKDSPPPRGKQARKKKNDHTGG